MSAHIHLDAPPALSLSGLSWFLRVPSPLRHVCSSQVWLCRQPCFCNDPGVRVIDLAAGRAEIFFFSKKKKLLDSRVFHGVVAGLLVWVLRGFIVSVLFTAFFP